jgi:hypothetical protein
MTGGVHCFELLTDKYTAKRAINKDIELIDTRDDYLKFNNKIIHPLNNNYDNVECLLHDTNIGNKILSFVDEPCGYLKDFENRYRDVRREFKSIIYDYIYSDDRGRDKVGNICDQVWYIINTDSKEGEFEYLYDFITPRLKRKYGFHDFLSFMLNGISQNDADYIDFKAIFKNYKRTCDEFIKIAYNSMFNYYDNIKYTPTGKIKNMFKSNETEGHNFIHMCQYSLDYDDYYRDDEYDINFIEELEQAQDERRDYFDEYNLNCSKTGYLKKFYSSRYINRGRYW